MLFVLHNARLFGTRLMRALGAHKLTSVILFALLLVVGYLAIKRPAILSLKNKAKRHDNTTSVENRQPRRSEPTGDDEASLNATETIGNLRGPDAEKLYWFPVEPTMRALKAHVRLCYVDTSDMETIREMDVNGFYRGENGCHFEGFDRLRKARRKLSSKCVKEAVDMESGEVIPDISTFLEEKYRETSEYIYDDLFANHGRAIYVLIYIAASDGAMRAPERRIITTYCLGQKGYGSDGT